MARRGPNTRKSTRTEVRYRVWLCCSPDQPMVPCMLSDISESGARLTGLGPGAVPDAFTLHLSEAGRLYRRCRVVWRVRKDIGVAFITEA